MTSSIVFRTILGAALALAALYCEAQTASRQAASTAAAPAYPSRPIRLIIPFEGETGRRQIRLGRLRHADTFQGAEAAGGTPEQFRSLMVREVKAWADVVKTVGIQPQ